MICYSCTEEKSENEFPWKNQSQGKRQLYCKLCKSKYNQEWYARHRDEQGKRVRANSKRYKQANLEILAPLKDVPCADCGGRFPAICMDFDHLEDFQKLNSVSRMLKGSQKKLLDEVAKCEVVCANCHRIRTHSRYYARTHGLSADPPKIG